MSTPLTSAVPEPSIRKATSNADFARRVGLHYTMASRLRNGKRTPSAETISAIILAFMLEDERLAGFMESLGKSQDAMGLWIRENLFEPTADQ